jgi:hypothetical protein
VRQDEDRDNVDMLISGYLHTLRYRRNVSAAAMAAIRIPVKKTTGRITITWSHDTNAVNL